MFRTASSLRVTAVAIATATAIAACGSSSPSSSSSSRPPTQAQAQQIQQALVSFTVCMRTHGVTSFPSPTSPFRFKEALAGTHSPAFDSAATACQHLLPGGRHPNPPDRHSQAQIAAMLAFARCLRSHGFQNFPDPASNGDMTHQMLANAGIDIHQPAVAQAADTCTSVTHGYITRAAVARFIAEG